MTFYRIYELNEFGRIVSGIDVVCPDDEAAFDHAAALFGQSARAEIWQGARCLGRLHGGSLAGSGGSPQQLQPAAARQESWI
jgi:hypothetical protein